MLGFFRCHSVGADGAGDWGTRDETDRAAFGFLETTGNQAAIEEWRQQQMKRMYSFDEFIECVKQRF